MLAAECRIIETTASSVPAMVPKVCTKSRLVLTGCGGPRIAVKEVRLIYRRSLEKEELCANQRRDLSPITTNGLSKSRAEYQGR
jgi:hypothetical protein